MNRLPRRALRVLALTAALTVAATLAAPAAYADDPGVIVTVDDATTPPIVDHAYLSVLDAAEAAAGGCVPYVYRWRVIWNPPTSGYETANGSVYLQESGGAEALLNCAATVRIRAWILDESVPEVFQEFVGTNTVVMTGKVARAVASVDVPYWGPDAPGIRPYGDITVHVEAHRRLANGSWSALPGGCIEYYFVHQPAIGISTSDPTTGPGFASCTAGAKIAVYDTADTVNAGT